MNHQGLATRHDGGTGLWPLRPWQPALALASPVYLIFTEQRLGAIQNKIFHP